MNTHSSGACAFGFALLGLAILGLEKRGPSVPRRLPSAPRPDEPTPPPILLLKESHTALPAVNELVRPEPARTKKLQLKPTLAFPDSADDASLRTLQNNRGMLTRFLDWIRSHSLGSSSTRRLQVGATVSLGEKRFVAVIQIDGLEFLIGGGATNVALLAQLNKKESFGDLLQETMTDSIEQIAGPAGNQTRKQA